MLSQPSSFFRCLAKGACTSRSSLLMGVTAIVSALLWWCRGLPSDSDLPVHQTRQEEVAGLGELPTLLMEHN